MFKWEKLGRIFNPSEVKDRPWLKEYAQAPATLIFDDFVRVYFSCRPEPDENKQYTSYSAYVDLDRRNLTKVLNVSDKPILELGKSGTFDEFGTYPVSVIRKGIGVWAYYAGWTRCESVPYNVAIGVAASSDQGKTFKKMGDGPVISYSLDEPFTVSGPKIRKFNSTYYMYYISGYKWEKFEGRAENIFKIRMATSEDGINWSRENRNLIDDKLDINECQASPDVIQLGDKYHMFFCYKYASDFRNNKDRGYRIGYACSDDLINWVRDDSQVGIDVSKEGWDSESIAYPHVFSVDGNTYMLYLGNQVGRHGFGLARLVDLK